MTLHILYKRSIEKFFIVKRGKLMAFQRGVYVNKQGERENSGKIKIVFVVSEAEIKRQEVLYDIISSLSRNKYEITLVAAPDIKLVEWVEILNRQRKLSINIIVSSYLKTGASLKGYIKAILKFHKLLKAGNYELIHFTGTKGNLLGRYLSKLRERDVSQCKSHYELEDIVKHSNHEKRKKATGFRLLNLLKKQERNPKDANSPSLKKNFSWVLSGNIAYALSKGILMVLIAKLGSPRMVGQFTLALAIAAPVFTLAGLRLRAIIATDTKNEYDFSYYILLRAITTTIAILITLLIVLIFGYSGEFAWVLIFIAIGRGIESISDIIFGLFENKERMNVIGKSMMIKSVLSVMLMGILFKTTGSLAGGAAGLATAWLIVLIFYDLINARPFISLKLRIKPPMLIKLFRTCIPLSTVSAIGSIEGNMSNYLIQGFLGSEILGFYSSIANLITVGDTVVNSLGSATTPRLAKYYSDGDKKSFVKTVIRLITVSSGLGAVGLILTAILGRGVLSLLYEPSYGEYWSIFLLLMIASCLRYMASCLNNSLTAARKLKIQPLINIAIIASTITFSIILIPSRGIEGVAYTVIISSYIDFLGNLLTNVYTI
jgi:O-antigen/teichoic acid export membrane protein